jgi:ribosomal-protein-alanine N-acetyltransferase
MEDGDIPSVLEIENLSFPNPWRASTFRGEIENELLSHPYVIIYKPLNCVIGHVVYWLIQGEVQISNIAVAPEFRHRGVAEEVMRRILDRVQKEGARYILLEVRPSNTAARSLYNKLGFKVVGIRKHYYHNPSEDAIIMGKILISNSL